MKLGAQTGRGCRWSLGAHTAPQSAFRRVGSASRRGRACCRWNLRVHRDHGCRWSLGARKAPQSAFRRVGSASHTVRAYCRSTPGARMVPRRAFHTIDSASRTAHASCRWNLGAHMVHLKMLITSSIFASRKSWGSYRARSLSCENGMTAPVARAVTKGTRDRIAAVFIAAGQYLEACFELVFEAFAVVL